MTRQAKTNTKDRQRVAAEGPAAVNTVHLAGRVAAAPETRELPSGDALVLARLVVPRADAARRRARQSVDTVDCVAWTAQLRRRVGAWRPGDWVEVEGAFRRRFYRSGAGVVSRVEVEVSGGRVIRRAAT